MDDDRPSRRNEIEDASTEQASLEPEEVRQIGPYRLREMIGEGGMGDVWLAQQVAPVKRLVALKVIKPGMDSRQVVARFEAERQALALMDHPAVAKVFDAGAAPDGRPYFVMEYVKGIRITDYCDDNRLTTGDRIELLLQVREGVQHAHHKGIIHRDIKPSNVLVGVVDGKPMVKIIDFGVAKAISQTLTEKSIHTQQGMVVGTPLYMSPEQAELTAVDIDTRSDVYSLGVLLYELLVGVLPFGRPEPGKISLEEIRRKITKEDPPKPSLRVRSQGDALSATVCRLRRTDVAGMRRALEGDLDWIAVKALEKDRTRRYGSPGELAADIRRHLEHMPVLAGPPAVSYRVGKFVRRNRIGVSFAAVLLMALIGLAASMTVQAGRIARERDRANKEAARASEEAERAREEAETARQVSDFLVRLFEVSDPGESRGNTVTARELLDQGALRIEEELVDQPAVRARLMDTMGRVFQGLGLFGQAEQLLVRALAIRRDALGQKHADVAESFHHLGWLQIYQGKLEPAEANLGHALALREELLGADHVDTAWVIYLLGVIHMLERNREEAIAYYDRAQRIFETELGPRSLAVAWCLNDRGKMLTDAGRYTEALPSTMRAYEIKREILGVDHPDAAASLSNAVGILVKLGEFDEARRLHHEAMKVLETSLGRDHPLMSVWLLHYAELQRRSGQLSDARATLARAMAIREADPGPTDEYEPDLLQELAFQELESGSFESARQDFERALKAHERISGPDHPEIAVVLEALTKLLRQAGNEEDAAALEARAEALRARIAAAN